MSLPAPARAWGCEGHQVIALLAEKHLTPHALAMAKKILAEGPVDPSLSRYCKPGALTPWPTPPPGPTTFADYAPKLRRGTTSISHSARNTRRSRNIAIQKKAA